MQERITRVVVTDQRVLVIGHSSSQAACVAISAAIQTAARIAYRLGLLENSPRLEENDDKPLYDIYMMDCEETRALVSGVVDSFNGINEVVPGALTISDVRKQPAVR